MSPLRVTGDAFHSTKTSGLNFQQLPGANGTAFSKFPKTGQPCFVVYPGLSLRAGGRGFSPATKRVAPSYFYWKIEEK